MSCILAIDQGTTGTTCLMVGDDGSICGRTTREIPPQFPSPGLVEHDPHELLARTMAAARDVIAMAGEQPVAVGLTNQRETVVLWERATGRAVAPAIVWQDRRTAARCAALAPEADRIAAITGLRPDPYFSATKLEWLLNQPGVRARAARGELAAGTIDSWLLWHLTGGTSHAGAVHATDHTNASRTMLYDIGARTWSEPLCALFGVPRELLPAIHPSAHTYGTTTPDLLGCAVPITGIAGDQQAALYGHGAWLPGGTKNTYGTGAFLLCNAGGERPVGGHGLLTTIACDADGAPVYALEASIFVAGAAVQWLRDGLGLIASASETEQLAQSLDGNDGVYFVPALTGLGAPDWEPDARGTIVGLTRGTTRAHLARAALEAMAYATRDVLSTMEVSSGVSLAELRVDGGATRNGWLLQFQADLLGIPVVRQDMVETTALGAAALAGVAAGVWRHPEALIAGSQSTTIQPGDGQASARAGHAGWRRAVRAALAWARDSAVRDVAAP